tara:strand:- start:623 stop:1357 length:735 start_codon:yes stop_codon:yes gene_type:complete
MKWIGYLLSSLWRLWFFIIFLIVFIAFTPFLFFFTAIIKNEIYVAKITRYWSKLTIYLSFIFPKIEWETTLNNSEQYIFCPNHVSTLDIPFILAVLPKPVQYMGKVELSKIPIFGYFFRNNSVVVDRSNKRDSYSAFIKAGEKLKKGLNMCIFPEGGIPTKNVLLKKFKNGPFRLAIEKNIKIIPITLPDNKKVFPKEYFKGRPGVVRVKIHAPIDPNSFSENSIENLNTSVYNTIFEQLNNYE